MAPRWILTVWTPKHLEPDWLEAADKFDAVSLKICDGHTSDRYERAAKPLLDEASSWGFETYGWGYHYCRTPGEAEAEAFAAAEACDATEVSTYFLDLEAEWAGVWGRPKTDNPEAAAIRFLEVFRMEAPTVRIVWNGLSRSAVYGRRYCTDRVVELCDAWAPQCYGRLDWKRRKRANKWRWAYPTLPRWPMVASGRIDRKGKPTLHMSSHRHSLDAFLASTHPQAVCVWYGAGSKGMLTEGNEVNPSWAEYLQKRELAV